MGRCGPIMVGTRYGLLLVVIALGGCSHSGVMRRVAPPRVTEFARTFVEALRTGQDSVVLARLTPRLQQIQDVKDSLAASRAEFPPGVPDQVELVDAQAFFPSAGAVRRALAFEMRIGDAWAVVHVLVLEEFDMLFVDGVGVRKAPASVRTINAFTLEGKTPVHLLILALLIAVPTFSLIVAVLVLQTPMRRRWLWAAMALLGAGRLGFNWTTGETFNQMISMQLLGAGFFRAGLAGPWWIVVSFPAGALIALDRRRRAIEASQRRSSKVGLPITSDIAPAPEGHEL